MVPSGVPNEKFAEFTLSPGDWGILAGLYAKLDWKLLELLPPAPVPDGASGSGDREAFPSCMTSLGPMPL